MKKSTQMTIVDELLEDEQLKRELNTMLNAAALMSDKDAKAHITKQAGDIFDQYHASLSATEFVLAQAQARYEALSALLNAKRKERNKAPRFINDNQPSDKEGNYDDQ